MAKVRCIAHNRQTSGAKLNHRIAEEAQLLAEERWIIEALKKIKSQKNGLQIERLHLESMRAKLIDEANTEQAKKVPEPDKSPMNVDVEIPNNTTSLPTVQGINPFSIESMDYNTEKLNNDELCNTEELNLSVTNSIFLNQPYSGQCDEEEDEEDLDNCLLDMDLLMSGK